MTVPPLEYSRTRGATRRATRLLAALTVAVLAFAALVTAHQVGLNQRFHAWRQSRRERNTFERCLSYYASPDHVVYEEGSARSRHWISPGDGFGETAINDDSGDWLVRCRVPDCVSAFTGIRRAWTRSTALFVHRMRAAGGAERLVIVYHCAEDGGQEPAGLTWAAVVTPLWRRNSWPVPLQTHYGRLFPRLQPGSTLRLFAGQPDPDDPTHFWYRYELNGQMGTVDAYLGDDDTLRFRIRDGPALGLWKGADMQNP